MEDKSDNDSSPCEDGLSNKLSVRKRLSTRRTSYRSATVGGRTTMTAPSDRTKSSNPDFCEEEKLDGCDGFSAKLGNIKVKEEYVSSGEEDTSSGQEENVSFRGGEEEVSFRRGEEDVSFRGGEEEVSFRRGEEEVSFRGGEEYVSSGEKDTSSGQEVNVSFKGGEEEVSFRRGEAEVSFMRGEEYVSSGEEDTSSGQEVNVSFKGGEEEVSFRRGEEEVSFRRGEEYVSSGEEDTSSGQEENMSSGQEVSFRGGEEEVSFREGEEEVSFRGGEEEVSFRGGEEEVSFKGGEEEVSFSAGDTSSRKKGLRNIEPVQTSTGTQHKRGCKMSKFTIGRSKEISEDLRKQVVEAHKSGKGYKRIAKELDLHLSTVRQIVYKWRKFSTVATLPRSGRPAKIGAKTKTSNPDSCEEEKIDDHDRLEVTSGNIQVKEEQPCSGEEDTSSGEGDLRNTETDVDKDSAVNQHKRGRDMSKFNIGRSKEISEDLRKQVVEAHKSGRGYKRIAKDLDLHQSTVRQIVYKWKKFSTVATLPRSGRPAKISAKARRTILKHMMENTRVTAKDLKASLALDNINVHESTIRKSLNKWCSWDFPMEEGTALQQE